MFAPCAQVNCLIWWTRRLLLSVYAHRPREHKSDRTLVSHFTRVAEANPQILNSLSESKLKCKSCERARATAARRSRRPPSHPLTQFLCALDGCLAWVAGCRRSNWTVRCRFLHICVIWTLREHSRPHEGPRRTPRCCLSSLESENRFCLIEWPDFLPPVETQPCKNLFQTWDNR